MRFAGFCLGVLALGLAAWVIMLLVVFLSVAMGVPL